VGGARCRCPGGGGLGGPEGSGGEGRWGEVESEGIDEDGNLVIDELLVAVDGAGDVVATDETVTVITPEGDAVVEETLSVMGEDGALHAVEEDITLLDADDD
jgi:hypothetical protein